MKQGSICRLEQCRLTAEATTPGGWRDLDFRKCEVLQHYGENPTWSPRPIFLQGFPILTQETGDPASQHWRCFSKHILHSDLTNGFDLRDDNTSARRSAKHSEIDPDIWIGNIVNRDERVNGNPSWNEVMERCVLEEGLSVNLGLLATLSHTRSPPHRFHCLCTTVNNSSEHICDMESVPLFPDRAADRRAVCSRCQSMRISNTDETRFGRCQSIWQMVIVAPASWCIPEAIRKVPGSSLV